MKPINPQDTPRAAQFEIWKNAPNPMLVFVKRLDVTNLVRISRRKHLKFNMLLDYCIGKAAIHQKEFYLLPVGYQLMQFDKIAINTMVKIIQAMSVRAILLLMAISTPTATTI